MNKFMKCLALVLVMGILLAFAACTPNSDTGSTPADSSATPNGSSSQTPQPSESTPQPSESTPTPSQKPVTYRVKVVDENGNPVAGVWVQICLDSNCFTPRESNEDGWVEFTNDIRDGYHVQFNYYPEDLIPEGKVLDTETQYDFGESTELTLTLKFVDQ